MILKIGCCGYPTSKGKYYQNFQLVEINSTFYQYPKLNTLSRWRAEAPTGFEFTLKTHQGISHVNKLKLTADCLSSADHMVEFCKTLNAKILLIQTPPSFTPNKENLKSVVSFFRKNSGRKDIIWVWETRGKEWLNSDVKRSLEEICEEWNIIHCTDPFITHPVYVGEIVYFRLHGLADRLYYYQYSNSELSKLAYMINENWKNKTVYLLFNNLSMFTDALRFKQYIETGKFPKLTDSFGYESFKKVVEKAKFPTLKSILIKRLGWTLFDVNPDEQLTVGSVLGKIPNKTYKQLDELLSEVKKTGILS